MIEKNHFRLIFNSKIFKIPSSFECLSDVNENIATILNAKQEYIVQSSVNVKIFENFIKYWVKKEIPDFFFDNIDEYEKLNYEFGIMKNIIELYHKFTPNSKTSSLLNTNSSLRARQKTQKKSFESITINYHQIIHHFLTNNGIETKSRFSNIKKELFQACHQGNIKFVDLLTKKEFKNDNDLTFVLNLEEKTAILFRNTSTRSTIIIPRSVNYKSEEFVVKSIGEGSFSNSKSITKIEFAENSEIELIDGFSFTNSSLQIITIPSSVKKIGEKAFYLCNKLQEFNIPADSKLNSIETLAFSKTSLKNFTIPNHLTEIGEKCFAYCNKLTTVTFSSESELKFIKEGAFKSTYLSSLSIPPTVVQIGCYSFSYCRKLKEISFLGQCSIESSSFLGSNLRSIKLSSSSQLKEGWCEELEMLEKVSVVLNENKNIQLFEGKYILGRSDSKSDIFDTLLFASRNIKDATIPSFVKHIGSYSFENCKCIEKVEFSKDSQLESIGNSAFQNASITDIIIPSRVKRIHMNAFSYIEKMKSVRFCENIELLSLDEYLFAWSKLTSLSIPSSIVEFKDGWCNGTNLLCDINVFKNNGVENITYFDNKFILGKSDLKSDVFDVLIFARRDIKEAIIPSFITKIDQYSFDGCEKLQLVHFEENSRLKTIENFAFSSTSLMKINLPRNLTKIGFGSFSYCNNLVEVNFPENSELELFERSSFSYSTLESISIPSSISKLDDQWCLTTPKVNNINIFLNKGQQNIVYYENKFILSKSNPKNDAFDVLLFARRDIVKARIPSFITKIENYAFDECKKLRSVVFPDDSKLTSLGKAAFAGSLIDRIFIPDHVAVIGQHAFTNCRNLTKVCFSKNSELNTIDDKAFLLSELTSFSIPSRVSRIGNSAFASCDKLKIIEINESSELISINNNIFQRMTVDIFMVPVNFNDLCFIPDNNFI